MEQNNLTISFLDKFQQKIDSLSRGSQPVLQDNFQNTVNNTVEMKNETLNNDDENVEMEAQSPKKEDGPEGSDNESMSEKPSNSKQNLAESEENEEEENQYGIPIASGYENLAEEESSNFYNELNEMSNENREGGEIRLNPSNNQKLKLESSLLPINQKDNLDENSYSDKNIDRETFQKPEFDMRMNSSGTDRKTEDGYSDGKQYGETWRRNFVIDLLKSLSELDYTKRNDHIKGVSHQIKVRNYEIKIWLSAYQIIFKIEKTLNKQRSSKEILDLVERELYVHVRNNRNERRYIVTKMLGYIVKSFGIANIKLDAWVKRFVNKYQNEFAGYEITRRKEKSYGEYDDDGYNKSGKIYDKKKRKGDERGNQIGLYSRGDRRGGYFSFENTREENISIYPISFREKIANKISEEISRAVDEIFQQKSEEFCLSSNIIKCIFKQHGEINLELKERNNGYGNHVSNFIPQSIEMNKLKFAKNRLEVQSMPLKKRMEQKKVGFEEDNDNIKEAKNSLVSESKVISEPVSDEILLSKLEEKVSSFVKSNLNCHTSALEKETESVMTSLSFNIRLKTKVRSQWLCLFLKKNNLTVDSNRCLRQIESNNSTEKGETKNVSKSQTIENENEEEKSITPE